MKIPATYFAALVVSLVSLTLQAQVGPAIPDITVAQGSGGLPIVSGHWTELGVVDAYQASVTSTVIVKNLGQAALNCTYQVLGGNAAQFELGLTQSVTAPAPPPPPGGRRTVVGMLILATIGGIVFTLAPSWPILLTGRMLMGAGFGVMLIGSMVVISRWFPPDRFSTLTAMVLSIGLLGNLAATTPLAVKSKIIISPATGAAGTKLTVTGYGFGANRPVTLKYNGVVLSIAGLSSDAGHANSGSNRNDRSLPNFAHDQVLHDIGCGTGILASDSRRPFVS